MMSCLILNTPVAYTKLRLPLTAWATSFGFVRWPLMSGGAQEFREGLCWHGIVDGICDGSPIVHVPTAGG